MEAPDSGYTRASEEGFQEYAQEVSADAPAVAAKYKGEPAAPLPAESAFNTPEDVLLAAKPTKDETKFLSGTVAAVAEAASHQGSAVQISNPANELGEHKEVHRGLPDERYDTEQSMPIKMVEEVASVADQAMEASIHKVYSSAGLNKEDKYLAELSKQEES